MEKTARRKTVARVIRILAATCVVVILFFALQSVFVPKFMSNSTGMLYCLYHGRANDTENLFLGSSAMYCSIDAVTLTEEYGLPSFCFGAGGQPIIATEVYLREFCKYVTPKRVYVEVATIFNGYDDITDQQITWSYAPLKASTGKFKSLYALYDSDFEKAFTGTYLPLFTYHNRWDSISKEDVGYLFMPALNLLADVPKAQNISFIKQLNDKALQSRGHTDLPDTKPAEILFDRDTSSQPGKTEIPQECVDAMKSMVDFCREKGIEIEFMKTPMPTWTKEQSNAVAALCEELGAPYFDMHYSLDEMGIDEATDFHDEVHLNASGAAKATRCFAEHILEEIGSKGSDA